MEEIDETDVIFLNKLSSLYEALTLSAVDPVVINYISEIENLNFYAIDPAITNHVTNYIPASKKVCMSMFYDAYGQATTEDLETAEKIMKDRISASKEEIILHHKYHAEFLELFYDIDENININNRKNVANSSINLADKVKEYLCNVVDKHNSRFKNEAFLSYPSCHRRYGFFIEKANEIYDLNFNDSSNLSGAEKDLNEIIELSESFSLIYKKIPIDKVATQDDNGIGIMDPSLRGRHELNIELMKRIGFELDKFK